MNNIDLKKKFEEYFNEQEGFGLRSERFYTDIESQRLREDAVLMTKWLEAAFIQGARAMAQDTVDTLRDYSTACAGIEYPHFTQSKAFGHAADNLMTYYTPLLQDVEVPCKPHPDAPHGFLRNASHNADRYVCECEHWEEPK